MNKRMRELMKQIHEKRELTRKFLEDGENKDIKKAQTVLEEAEELKKEYEIEKKLFEEEKEESTQNIGEIETKKVDGFKVMAKLISGGQLNKLEESEKSLIVGGENGENFLIPEDVDLKIRELRRNYVSAKDIVNVISTNTISGTTNWEVGKDKMIGLTPLSTDGEEIPYADTPQFIQKSWKIEFYSKLLPISRILLENEQASLMSYLNRWFLRDALISENKKIFEELKKDKTIKTVKGWKELKKLINVDLDISIRLTSFIVTNQTGFGILDEEEDKNGRPILQPDPTNPTQKTFQGLPIKVYSDQQLPNISGKSPMFVGDMKQGVDFIERKSLEFAVSEDFLFHKNQNCVRVIEGFGVMGTDKEAYFYVAFQASEKSSVAA